VEIKKIKKRGKNMQVIKNDKKKNVFVRADYGDVATYISQAYAGSKGRNRLTIKTADTRIDLNGHQINALKKVLSKANSLAA
jgi:hypothetical protein